MHSGNMSLGGPRRRPGFGFNDGRYRPKAVAFRLPPYLPPAPPVTSASTVDGFWRGAATLGTACAHVIAVVGCGYPLWVLTHDVRTTKEAVADLKKGGDATNNAVSNLTEAVADLTEAMGRLEARRQH